LNKPISTATQTAFNTKLETIATKTALQSYTATTKVNFDGSEWVKKTGVQSSNGGSYVGTIVNVDANTYWERQYQNGIYRAVWFGIVSDNNTINTTALNYTFSILSDGDELVLDAGTTLIDGALTIAKKIKLTGKNATISTSSIQPINISSLGLMSGITFNRVQLVFAYNFTDNAIIEKNEFQNASIGIYFTIGFASWTNNVTVTQNTFNGCGYGIYGGLDNGIISYNTFKNSTGRNIELSAAQNTKITYNNIANGITGIAFLNARLTNKVAINNNYIANNYISGITEESISMDVHGNSTPNSGSIISGTVSSFSIGSSTTAIIPNFTIPSYEYLNYYVCFTTGNNKGNIYKITYMGTGGTAYLQFDTPLTNIQNGDAFVIQIAIHSNIVENNTIENGFSGVVIWGNGFFNKIRNNKINNLSNVGIGLYTLTSVIAGGWGLVENCEVTNNILQKCSIEINTNKYGAVDYYSKNICTGNTVKNGVINYKYQTGNYIDANNDATINVANITDNTKGLSVLSINAKKGDIVLTKADISLANVDNTSDANKPVSTASQALINTKQDNLVSGTNLKTINSSSILGSGNVAVGDVFQSIANNFSNTNTFLGSTIINNSTGVSKFQLIGANPSYSSDLFFQNSASNTATFSLARGGGGNAGDMNLSTNAGNILFSPQGFVCMKLFNSSRNVAIQNTGTFVDISSAILQVNSTTQGIVISRMTTTQRDAIASPAEGLEIYNLTTHVKNIYNNASWVDVKEFRVDEKLKIATGSNASIGTATLVAGTVTVSTTAVKTGSLVWVQYHGSTGTATSVLIVPTITDSTSFIITAITAGGTTTNVTDTNTVKWWVIN
jgi:hypothetical protein